MFKSGDSIIGVAYIGVTTHRWTYSLALCPRICVELGLKESSLALSSLSLPQTDARGNSSQRGFGFVLGTLMGCGESETPLSSPSKIFEAFVGLLSAPNRSPLSLPIQHQPTQIEPNCAMPMSNLFFRPASTQTNLPPKKQTLGNARVAKRSVVVRSDKLAKVRPFPPSLFSVHSITHLPYAYIATSFSPGTQSHVPFPQPSYASPTG